MTYQIIIIHMWALNRLAKPAPEFVAWRNDNIHVKQWDIITLPNFNSV